MSPNLCTTDPTPQSYTSEVVVVTWQVSKWSPKESQWKTLQDHWLEGQIKSGIGTLRVEQNQTSQRKNRESMVDGTTVMYQDLKVSEKKKNDYKDLEESTFSVEVSLFIINREIEI